jgi:tyrosine-protein phosphatase OCA6
MSAMSLPPLVPPFNYALVEEGLHRGAYPTLKNFRFLRRLRLSTIISLTPEEPNVDLVEFCTAEDISLKHISVEKFQESVTITAPMIAKVINLLVSTASLPVYIHCLDGANNTSLVIAVLRKLQNWKTSAIFAEFSRFLNISHALML